MTDDVLGCLWLWLWLCEMGETAVYAGPPTLITQ